jgi:hypothetical protein
MESGSRAVESLRQVALRVRPLHAVLDEGQRAFVEALCRPQVTMGSHRRPGILLPEVEAWAVGGTGRDAPILSIHEARGRLLAIAAWTAVARALSLRVTKAAVAAAPDSRAVLASLALGAVLYGRVDLGVAEATDVRRFAAGYLTPRFRVRAVARAALRRALLPWTAAHNLNIEAIEPLVGAGFERLAEVAARGDLSAAAAREWVYFA